jgi:hypothetical protein
MNTADRVSRICIAVIVLGVIGIAARDQMLFLEGYHVRDLLSTAHTGHGS